MALSETSELLICYNKGCGKRFNLTENTTDSCCYHPGEPVFHDAIKGWSCCNKKSTDFTEFLSFPGCKCGHHNNNKPPEKDPVEAPLEKGSVISVGTPSPQIQAFKPELRPSDSNPLVKLKYSVSLSLKNQLAKIAAQPPAPKEKEAEDGAEVQAGNKCLNRGCSEIYKDASSDLGECLHHPGAPVFHEGYKFYTCCCKKTSDFNEFLRQEGCTTGDHKWKNDKGTDNLTYCRKDFHQTPKYAVVAVYAKNCIPEDCIVEANETVLSISLSFNGGEKFAASYCLFGVVEPAKSSVAFLGPKVEINLFKRNASNWTNLEYLPSRPPAAKQRNEEDVDAF